MSTLSDTVELVASTNVLFFKMALVFRSRSEVLNDELYCKRTRRSSEKEDTEEGKVTKLTGGDGKLRCKRRWNHFQK